MMTIEVDKMSRLYGMPDSGTIKDIMVWWYQRRTQKGMMGRTEKTGHNCTAKNPRLLKACNITVTTDDMGEFFFIFMRNELPEFFCQYKEKQFFKCYCIFCVKFWKVSVN